MYIKPPPLERNIHLTPEIEAGLGAEAAARGVSVDALVAEAVGDYLRKSGSPSSVRRVLSRERRAEMAWALKPDRHNFGKWLANVKDSDAPRSEGRIYEHRRFEKRFERTSPTLVEPLEELFDLNGCASFRNCDATPAGGSGFCG